MRRWPAWGSNETSGSSEPGDDGSADEDGGACGVEQAFDREALEVDVGACDAEDGGDLRGLEACGDHAEDAALESGERCEGAPLMVDCFDDVGVDGLINGDGNWRGADGPEHFAAMAGLEREESPDAAAADAAPDFADDERPLVAEETVDVADAFGGEVWCEDLAQAEREHGGGWCAEEEFAGDVVGEEDSCVGVEDAEAGVGLGEGGVAPEGELCGVVGGDRARGLAWVLACGLG